MNPNVMYHTLFLLMQQQIRRLATKLAVRAVSVDTQGNRRRTRIMSKIAGDEIYCAVRDASH